MASKSIDRRAASSIEILDRFFKQYEVEYWLEAGTALAAWRDKQMMDWDHDLDFAIWFEACPDIDVWKNYFTDTQFELIVQRNLPYLDNIIQLKCKEAYKQDLIDIDIYLYKRMDGQAYMRWIHKPSGFGASAKRFLFQVLFSLFKPLHARWQKRAKFIPYKVRYLAFWCYFYLHVKTSSCRYHRFPEKFFLNLRSIEFCGFWLRIAADTEDYLTHRYGKNWKTPDREFNQSGKWQASAARPSLPMDLLPYPKFFKDH